MLIKMSSFFTPSYVKISGQSSLIWRHKKNLKQAKYQNVVKRQYSTSGSSYKSVILNVIQAKVCWNLNLCCSSLYCVLHALKVRSKWWCSVGFSIARIHLYQFGHPEQVGGAFLRNVGTFDYCTVQKPKRRPSLDQKPPERLKTSGEVFHTQLAQYEDVEEWGRETPYIATYINRVKVFCDVLVCWNSNGFFKDRHFYKAYDWASMAIFFAFINFFSNVFLTKNLTLRIIVQPLPPWELHEVC